MDRKILNVSINEIRQYSKELAKKLKNENINVIVPILKGGVVLASMLGRDLRINKFACIHIATTLTDTRNAEFKEPVLLGVTNEKELANANVLIVDDICDSGRSLEFAKKIISTYQPKSITSCVAINVNKQTAQKKDIYFAKDYSVENYWIVFPWED